MKPYMNGLLVFIDMKEKKTFFEKKKIKMANSKKSHFQAPPILIFFMKKGY